MNAIEINTLLDYSTGLFMQKLVSEKDSIEPHKVKDASLKAELIAKRTSIQAEIERLKKYFNG